MPFAGQCRDSFRSCRRALNRRGTTTVEFALVGGLLVSLLLGTIEISRYLITREAVRTAMAEAVRMTTLRGSRNLDASSPACTSLAGSLTGMAASVPFLTAASLTANMSGCVTQAGVTTVSITVHYPFAFGVALFGVPNRPITETAQAIFN